MLLMISQNLCYAVYADDRAFSLTVGANGEYSLPVTAASIQSRA